MFQSFFSTNAEVMPVLASLGSHTARAPLVSPAVSPTSSSKFHFPPAASAFLTTRPPEEVSRVVVVVVVVVVVGGGGVAVAVEWGGS